MPLTVKFRTGWEGGGCGVALAPAGLKDAGADALFSSRTAPDQRSGRPGGPYIGKVKQAVDIPVFGNGEVFTEDDCERMIRPQDATGCPWAGSPRQNPGCLPRGVQA
ncbi:MAG: tRNA-dihydrouridine synthase [Desulfobacterales bacterium]